MRRLFLVFVAILMGWGLEGPALAEWRRAESDRFIVYSNGREQTLRDFVQKLETFDRVLRFRLGLPVDTLPPRKLPIYLVSNRRELGLIFPNMDRFVGGVYSPTSEDIFATAIRDGDDDILLHEYAHHFMYQNSETAYPGWLIEGFAEYLMTAEIDDDRVQIGGYNQNRAAWLLNSSWIPLEDLLSQRPLEARRSRNRETYYPVAWLLTHWFMSDPERSRRLEAYVEAINRGGDPIQEMVTASGMTLDELRRELRGYMRERLQVRRYESDFPEAQMTVTVLPPSADDLLLIGQRLKFGVPEDQRAATAEEVRRLAARHPEDPFALLQLGHAELHFGDPEAGEAILTRLLESEPENVEALQLMATRYIRLAEEADEPLPLITQARSYLARAYAADDANYYTFILLGRTREGASNYPTENDIATWELAYAIAPQLSAARLGYASALMRVDRFEEAAILLRPLANAPHGGQSAEAAQELLARAEAGQDPLSDAEIAAAIEAEEAAPPQPETPEDGSEPGEAQPEQPSPPPSA